MLFGYLEALPPLDVHCEVHGLLPRRHLFLKEYLDSGETGNAVFARPGRWLDVATKLMVGDRSAVPVNFIA